MSSSINDEEDQGVGAFPISLTGGLSGVCVWGGGGGVEGKKDGQG